MAVEKYILLKGDISGIQEFIFNVKSDGAAKSLKGRSFFIKVLTEIAIQYLFDLFAVNERHRSYFRISTSGGNFFIKLPKIEDCESKINELQIKLSISLRYSGINVSINAVELNESNYNKCLVDLNQKVRESKLKLHNTSNYEEFEMLFSADNKKGFLDVDENSKWKGITDKIRSSKFISIIKTNPNDINLKIFNDSIELIGYKCEFHNKENKANPISLSKYLESIFPLKFNKMKEFEDLCKDRNDGDRKLGILKMDVDNLGVTLESVTSINEHTDFDIELSKFFNNDVYKYINEHFPNEIYTVTAGGDDSFFLGHWRNVLDLAMNLNRLFTDNKYFKGKGLTISAGYIIVKPKFPVIRFAQIAEEALHKAKYEYGKGNICVFDEVVSWDLLNQLLKFKKILAQSVDKKSKGLLAKARQSAIKGIDEDQINLKDNWEIAYYLRDVKDKKLIKELSKNIENSSNIKGSDKTKLQLKRSLRLILPIAARLTELEKR